jgi:hypothetical protein
MAKSKKIAQKPALNKPDVMRSLHKDRVKDIAHEIAGSKTKGFTKEWEEYREKEYKYWLKRIRWACRPLQ